MKRGLKCVNHALKSGLRLGASNQPRLRHSNNVVDGGIHDLVKLSRHRARRSTALAEEFQQDGHNRNADSDQRDRYSGNARRRAARSADDGRRG